MNSTFPRDYFDEPRKKLRMHKTMRENMNGNHHYQPQSYNSPIPQYHQGLKEHSFHSQLPLLAASPVPDLLPPCRAVFLPPNPTPPKRNRRAILTISVRIRIISVGIIIR